MGLDEKPLALFKELDREGKKPMFMLRRLAGEGGPVGGALGGGGHGGGAGGVKTAGLSMSSAASVRTMGTAMGGGGGAVNVPGGVL